MKRLIGLVLMAFLVLMPQSFASKDIPNGDIGYEDGYYLLQLKSFGVEKGDQRFGPSKVGKISENEKSALLKDKKNEALIKAYNSLYKVLIKFYNLGAKHMDKWDLLKDNMDEAFIGNITKGQWIKVYEKTATTLGTVKMYFSSLGLSEKDITEESTYKMIPNDDMRF